MQRQARQNPTRVSLLDLSVATSYIICPLLRDVCGRGNTVHPHHRVGDDGQKQILSTQHAVLVLSQVLPVSPDSDQDSSSSAKTKSHVQW